jgi:hypothetical protein
MMMRDPAMRLGLSDKKEIKNHSFFKNINWDDVKELKT